MAGFLLERGAAPNHAGAGRTALHSAVQQRMPGLARQLLARGADPPPGLDFVEGQDKYGQRWFDPETTPLQRKAQAAVDYCLELGLDINAANALGQRAIFGGVYFRSPEMVKFLVDRGADVNVVNKRGQTPWLVTQGEYRSGSFYVDEETGRFLAGLGADTALGRDLGPEFAGAR